MSSISKQTILSCVDYTLLSPTATTSAMEEFCQQALAMGGKGGHIAAVCVYPSSIEVVKSSLGNSGIKVATVAGGFPHGQLATEQKATEVCSAVVHGADEVDVVINRAKMLEENVAEVEYEVRLMKCLCQGHTLKVILEVCDLASPELIREASLAAINGGADFIKTSTGKGSSGATLESVRVMLEAIKESGQQVGLKVAGGVRTMDDAVAYAELAEKIMGRGFVQPATFRIGTSRELV